MSGRGPDAPWTSDDPPAGARAAATLILMREGRGEGAPAELLMLQRASSMAFAADAIVFPGGKVEEADRALAAALDHDLAGQDAAARIAAIRETIEEAGIAVGLSDPLPDEAVTGMREALAAGATLADLLDLHGVTVDLAALIPFARWCPKAVTATITRRFDTRFYLARASVEGSHSASVDATENVRLRWASAAALVADCAAGRERAIFPTRRNLERLTACATFEEAVALARRHPIEMVTPWVEDRDGESHLCIPDHLGYPVTSEARATLARG